MKQQVTGEVRSISLPERDGGGTMNKDAVKVAQRTPMLTTDEWRALLRVADLGDDLTLSAMRKVAALLVTDEALTAGIA